MALINITHPDISKQEQTRIETDAAAGVTSLTVKNNDNFANGDYVVLGDIGNERSEIKQLSGVSSVDTLSIAATSFDHKAGTAVTKIKYNQAKIYRATSESGSYSVIATVNIQVDYPNGTLYDDTSGTSSSWYKITYYNSSTGTESAASDAIQATGFAEGSVGDMVDDVYDLIGDPERKTIDKETVVKKLNRQQTEWWLSPYVKRSLKDTDTLTTTADQNYVELHTNFDKLDGRFSVKYEYNPSASNDRYYYLNIISESRFWELYGDLTADSDDTLQHCYVDTNYSPARLYLGPTPASSSKNIVVKQYLKPTALDTDGDETLCPAPRILTYRVAAEIIANTDKELAAQYRADANSLIVSELNYNRTRTGSFKIKFRKDRGRGKY